MTRTWSEQQEHERKMVQESRRAWLVEALSQYGTISATARAVGMDRASMSRETGKLNIMRWPNMQGTGSGQACPRRDDRARVLSNQRTPIRSAADELGLTLGGVIRLEQRLGLRFARERDMQ
jgi:transcriptional regulator with GAF, ATPase, and Fis domain